MKWWHILLAIIGIFIISGFIVPPSIRCKFLIWDRNACSDVQKGVEMLGKVGVDIDPNKPTITQFGELTNIGNSP